MLTPRAASLAAVLLAGSLAVFAHAATGDVTLRIASGNERGTEIDVARDMSVLVAPDARIDLEALATAGSVENVRRLRNDRTTHLALVQADVFQAYVDLAAAGDAEASALIRPVRAVVPLFDEEIHFVVRADAPMRFVDEIRDARVNLGERGSGSALTVASLYRLMFDAPLPDARATHYGDEEALVRLVTDRSVDVVTLVGGQPLRLIEDMRPEARKHVRLLRLGDGLARDKALRRYALARLRADSYPNLLDRDIDTLAVPLVLMTVDDPGPVARDAVVRFAGALCRNLGRLKRHGHPKWREVELRLPDLGRGWVYEPATSRALASCIADRVSAGTAAR